MQVARVGGTDIKSLTLNILRRTVCDSVGSLFSYAGGKKNVPSSIYVYAVLYLVSEINIYLS